MSAYSNSWYSSDIASLSFIKLSYSSSNHSAERAFSIHIIVVLLTTAASYGMGLYSLLLISSLTVLFCWYGELYRTLIFNLSIEKNSFNRLHIIFPCMPIVSSSCTNRQFFINVLSPPSLGNTCLGSDVVLVYLLPSIEVIILNSVVLPQPVTPVSINPVLGFSLGF